MNLAQNNGDDLMTLTLSKDLGSRSEYDKTFGHGKPICLVRASDVSSLKKKLTDSGHENAIIFGNSTLTLVK